MWNKIDKEYLPLLFLKSELNNKQRLCAIGESTIWKIMFKHPKVNPNLEAFKFERLQKYIKSKKVEKF